ncbi:MAG: fructose-1,6-bisphosphatase [Bacteroidales bacterium]|nr:fructose-1,6-bisphosphatase [Bacteroidales bacterium]MBQ8645414.1 fructose-1,6-bisphosphatase [Bacteroidales bacterium]MBR1950832.1 fructose-1,6-bisphosphatase [Bacteroidales bacterium]MBR2437747.1 fructose-1,6-bisphosphatase [Bacteroidales bacterium]MBR4088068.1 fructose-1,6-bisphosphatase [Bacteroidales bacterium]
MKRDLKYLQLLSKSFPTIQAASTEIINLEAILNLPKGTEHFVTDLHGEHEAFQHVLKNASGVIKRKVEDIFGHSLRETEKSELCTLIYYPEEKLKIIKIREKERALHEWYKVILMRLVKVCSNVSTKYTRSKVRKAMPQEYEYIIQELLHESKSGEANKHNYITAIVETIISTGRADHFIIAICNLIQRLTIDSLHIIGDIYDRGPGAHIILDILENYHNWDVQWGNHDLVWMGAAAGSKACVANVVRMCSRYANFKILEEGYGINLLPLVTFAMDVYGDDPCTIFRPKGSDAEGLNPKQTRLVAQMHKAITIMQFKLEYEIISRRPEFGMDDRNLLHLIDRERGVIVLDGKEYPLRDDDFQTVDPADPYKLTPDEERVINRLTNNFVNSAHLAKHMQLLYSHGALYLVRNSNLLFHGSVPLNEDGSFKSLNIQGKDYAGKALFDKIDQIVRQAYFETEKSAVKQFAQDFVWYLWCGPVSPPFDKNRMATFERYFLSDKEAQKEHKGWYNIHKNNKEICEKILAEFGIEGEPSHIINGHIPVKTTKGESPIKAGGRLLVIDGGYSKPYQAETGIAGYTLIYNSYGLRLVQHEPFESTQIAIEQGKDIISETIVVEFVERRKFVRDTDIGKKLIDQIDDLKQLLVAFRKGQIR